MRTEHDAEAVFAALTRVTPQDADELAENSGVRGQRLEDALAWLEARRRSRLV